ncbi:hypothetical protein [Roseateles sp. L2-2]|uniref:hypothetical protein n=1 Tax=Roseateles sp. L2-2 TaxID=3422597 RepID=UPI003D36BD8C
MPVFSPRTARFVAGLLVTVATASAAAANCDVPKLEQVDAADPQCLYFTGTGAYREKDFATSARVWGQLVELKLPTIEHRHLQLDAANNLGFLLFTGKGVDKDRKRAIRLWEDASAYGQEESTYHLCHVYGDRDSPDFKREVALIYCREAHRRYERLSEEERSGNEVIDRIDVYLEDLAKP